MVCTYNIVIVHIVLIKLSLLREQEGISFFFASKKLIRTDIYTNII